MRECPACKLCFSDTVNNCPIDGDPTFHSIAGDPILEGKYQLEKRLGQGGMGVVYKARHNFLKTAHAIKVILPDLVGNDPNLVTRFRQEAIAAAAIRHQNIVNTTDFGVVNGKMPFIVMEFVKGESLHDLLVREKRLPAEKALEILTGIGAGVAAAHRQGIVHRDLKPLNVMLCADKPLVEAVKILDFGLAKIKSGELLGSFIQAQTTGLMGSPYYMAPEQWSDDEPDVRADVYSLGVMLYQMLAGDVPFKGTSIPSIMRKHLSQPPPSLVQLELNLAPDIEQVVAHALEKDPEKRTQTVEQLVSELRTAVGAGTAEIHLTDSAFSRSHSRSSQSIDTGRLTEPQIAVEPIEQTTLRVLTNPPQAKVFLDNKLIGTSEPNGWLITPNVARGSHRLRVTSDGFADSDCEINCESETFQAVVQLRSLLATNVVQRSSTEPTKQNFAASKNNAGANADSMVDLGVTNLNAEIALNNRDAALDAQDVGIRSNPEPNFEKTSVGAKSNVLKKESVSNVDYDVVRKPKRQSYVLPLATGVGVVFLLFLTGGGLLAWRIFFPPVPADISNKKTGQANSGARPLPSPIDNSPKEAVKPTLVKIEGGKFMMGTNDGESTSRPAHAVTVASFMMDKTEVTVGEYAQFVAATGQRAPASWGRNAEPPAEMLNLPVVWVSLDDAKTFAAWRSERDKMQYRLPTEEEWEYAARNGAKDTLYPWGDGFENNRAVVDASSVAPVGSMPGGANDWGVVDLIGNVWEWTETPLKWYPGSKGDASGIKPGEYIIRGGSFSLKVVDNKLLSDKKIMDATTRQWVNTDKTDERLGFRLVAEIKK